jgi:hypothetical protein
MNKMMLVPLVGLLFAALAWFGVVLPASFTQEAVIACVMLIIAAVTAWTRFMADDAMLAAKHWWQSRVLLTQFATAGFSVLALFGVALKIPVEGVVEAVMLISTFASAIWLRKPQAYIK